jgi:hypothetical protein
MFEYNVDGVPPQAKPITREVFNPAGTLCH